MSRGGASSSGGGGGGGTFGALSAFLGDKMRQAFGSVAGGNRPQTQQHATQRRRLLAIDFDNTISQTNTYAYFRARWSIFGRLDPELDALVSQPSFHPYYNRLFKLLVEVLQTTIEQIILEMAAAQHMNPGMQELLSTACAMEDVDVAIVSDSNDLLLRAVLDKWQISEQQHRMHLITNHAELVPIDGSSTLRTMHVTEHDAGKSASKCRWCRASLCKGRALHAFMQRSSDIAYDQIVVVGDSGGDLCMAARCATQRHFIAAPRNSELARLLTALDRSERRTGPTTNNSLRVPLEHQLIFANASTLLRPLLEDRAPENSEDVASVLSLKQAALAGEQRSTSSTGSATTANVKPDGGSAS